MAAALVASLPLVDLALAVVGLVLAVVQAVVVALAEA
jgi:hypothetical protein